MARYIPPLSLLISVNDLPSSLGFVENSLNSIFSKLYFKAFYTEGSIHTHEVNYNITIVSFERLGLNLGGEEGFSLVLNPGFVEGDTSEFPMSILYNWPLLKYTKSFDLESFSFSIEAIYSLLLELGRIDEVQLFSMFMNVFYPDYGIDQSDSEEPFQIFIDDFNTNNNPATPLTLNVGGNEIEIIEDLITQLSSNGNEYSVFDFVLNDYLSSDDDFGSVQKKLERLFYDVFGSFTVDNFQKFLTPNFLASLNNLFLALEFPRSWLKPVDGQGEVIEDDSAKSLLTYNVGGVSYHSEKGFEFINPDNFDLTPSQIGDTGLLININNLKFDFRTDRNIPEADADRRPNEFQGVYADLVSITLPKKWFSNADYSTLQLAGRNLLIGTGGVSGTISLETLSGDSNNGNAYLGTQIGNWFIGFNYFDVRLKQNIIEDVRIEGLLTIPGLKEGNADAKLMIVGDIESNGNFELTFSDPQGVPFTLFDFVTFNILSAHLGEVNDNFFLGVSCEIWFQDDVMNKLIGDQKIIIPKLRIYENGRMEIEGGNTSIPTNISLNLGPVEVAVTNVHFGSHQQDGRNYNYWGFDGAISIDPLGIDARGEGIKYYYTVDNDDYNGVGDSFIHIKTIAIDLIIPGTASPEAAMAIINGALSIPDPGESGEYQGEISLKLPKAKIAAYAAMRLHPKYPAFVVDANVDLPKPIPIGPVGIYGFRGLLGYRYLVEKEAVGLASDAKWQEYYKAPPRGIHISKFSQPEDTENYQNPIALGAGAIFGTSFDGGSLLSVRAMLVLSLPTAVVIDGSASILAKRIGLDSPTEPPFYAFAAWGPNSLEFGIGADYSIPDTGNNRGWLLDIQADVEAYFPFNNPSGWYVNFGTEQNRVSAEFLTLFTTQSYLMLSSQGIRAGAKASFLLEKRFGPAKVKISAYVEVGGQISFERPQIGGFIGAGGQILVDIWVLKLDIGLDALLAVEAAKPFLIYAKLDVRGCIKVLFAKVCKSFTVKLKWEYDSTVDRTPVPPLPYTNSSRETDRTEELVKGVHMLTNKTYPIQKLEVRNSGVAYIPNAANIDTIIPLDTYIDLKSVKGLIPNINSQKIGGNVSGAHNYTDLIPPQKVVRGGNELRQVKHKYSIEEIELKIWSGNSWEDYEPFKAVVEEEERDQLPSLIGYWQKSDKQYNTIRLMATTPMTYTEAGEPGWYVPEEHGITASQLFCKDEERSIHCGNFLNKEVGKEYFPPAQYYGHYINGAYFTLEGTYYVYDDLEDNQDKFLITNRSNTHGFNKSLQFENHKHLVLLLEEPSIEVRLKLNSDASSVTISYYKSVISAGIIPVYELIHEEQKTAAELQNEVIYINENEHISKVIIRPVEANQEEIAQLEQEIAAMFQQDYRNSNGIITGGIPANPELYQELKDQLDSLRGAGCSIDRGGDNDGGPGNGEDEDCEKDEALCGLYEDLLNIFNTCFLFPISSTSQVDQSCFDTFYQELQSFINKNPEYRLEEVLEPEYSLYFELRREISGWWEEGGEINIRSYVNFRDTAFILLERIRRAGNCHCGTGYSFDPLICHYYNTLNALLAQYFTVNQEEEIGDNLSYYNVVYEIIRNGLINSTLLNQPEMVEEISPLFDLYRQINEALQEGEQTLEMLDELKTTLASIVAILRREGYCDCETGSDVPGLEGNYNCYTSLQEFCWMTVENFEYNETIPGQEAIEEDYEAMVEAIENTAQPIWRPNSKYYLRFRLKDEVDGGENEGIYDYYYGFKTVGPIGHYHLDPNVNDLPVGANTDNFPLNTLSDYIDFRRSYPDAKGNLLKAKPLFYGFAQCKINLFFLKPMVYHMLTSWPSYQGLPLLNGDMHVAIKDPVTEEIIPYPLPSSYEQDSVPIPQSLSWNQDLRPLSPIQLETMNNLIEYANENYADMECTPVLGRPIVPRSPTFSLILTNLKPEKLYTVIIYNAFDSNGNGSLEDSESKQIHEYVFKTSRYENFRKQIESYLLEGEENSTPTPAIFDLPIALNSNDIDIAYQLISDPTYTGSSSLERQFYHKFDRIMEGVFGFEPLPVAVTTEFNKIIDSNTGDVVALLVRNPEPFNNPKIPIAEIENTIKVMASETMDAVGYSVLFSNDYSQALIMNTSKHLSDEFINLKFIYKIWDGSEYIVEEEPGVPNDEKLNTVYIKNISINPEN